MFTQIYAYLPRNKLVFKGAYSKEGNEEQWVIILKGLNMLKRDFGDEQLGSIYFWF